MRSKVLILMFAILICPLIFGSRLLAQSEDRNNPTPLQSPVISGLTSPIGAVYWYKLTAGPGELVIDMQVIAIDNGFGVVTPAGARFVLYDGDMQEVFNEAFSSGAVARKYGSLTLQGKQDFLLSITLGEGMHPSEKAGGTYIIRFKGSIDLPSKESEEDDD